MFYGKQMTLINTLKGMKDRPNICRTVGQIPMNNSLKMERDFRIDLTIRQEQYRLEDIYKRDTELYEWWKRHER